MSFAIFKGETSVKELVNRLFGLSSKSSAATVNQAANALLEANPQLQNINSVAVGSVINVPATAPPLVAAQAAPAAVTRSVAIAAQAQQTLDLLSQRLSAIDMQSTAATSSLLTLAQSKQAQTIAQSLPELKAQLPTLVSSLQTTASETKASQEIRSQALSTVRSNLTGLAQ